MAERLTFFFLYASLVVDPIIGGGNFPWCGKASRVPPLRWRFTMTKMETWIRFCCHEQWSSWPRCFGLRVRILVQVFFGTFGTYGPYQSVEKGRPLESITVVPSSVCLCPWFLFPLGPDNDELVVVVLSTSKTTTSKTFQGRQTMTTWQNQVEEEGYTKEIVWPSLVARACRGS